MLLLASLVLPSPPLLTAPALANGRLPRLYMGEGYATDQPIGTGASAAAFGAPFGTAMGLLWWLPILQWI